MIDPNPDFECPEENGAVPHDELCEQYYDCYNGVATHFTCTDVMLFDLTYAGCNYAQVKFRTMFDATNTVRPLGIIRVRYDRLGC